MSNTVEELGMEFGELLDASVSGVKDVDLAIKAGQAKVLLEKLSEAYDAWHEKVRAECLRQDQERQQALASVGLTGLPTSAPKKRGRKPKSELPEAPVDEADVILDAE